MYLLAFLFFSCKGDFDINTHLEQKIVVLQKKGNVMLQPHVVVVCDDDSKLADSRYAIAYAVIQADLIYTFNSIFEAVDMCMKAVFAFNLQFPPAAHGAWFFLQRAVYNISTKYDRQCGKVKQLLIDTK